MAEEIEVKFREPTSIMDTLKPMIYFSWLMGTGICRPRNLKKVTICIKIFHFSICSAVVAYGIVDFFRIQSVIHNETYKIIYYSNKAIIYLTSYYYVLFGLFHYNKWKLLIERFESVEKKIRREISVSDRSAKIYQIVAFILILILGPLSLIAHVVYYYFTNPSEIVGSDVLNYYIFTQTLTVNYGFVVIVCMIYNRFKIVNNLIKSIGDSYTAPWIVMRINRLRELHFRICGLVTIVNDAHGTHLLMSSANSFMMVLALLFRIYLGVTSSSTNFILANNAIWLIYATQFAANCFVCTLASGEAKKTGIFIHEVGLRNNQFSNKRLYSNNAGNRRSLNYQTEAKTYEGSLVQNEISFFSSQLEQNPVTFRACDFFVINNSLLRGFIGVITTYLIILIQFQDDKDRVQDDTTNSTSVITTTEMYNLE